MRYLNNLRLASEEVGAVRSHLPSHRLHRQDLKRCYGLYQSVLCKRKRRKISTITIAANDNHLRYRLTGSATLYNKTPGGSIIRRQRIIDTYCVNISFVSAPGCKSRFRFLRKVWWTWANTWSWQGCLLLTKGGHKLAALIYSSEAFLWHTSTMVSFCIDNLLTFRSCKAGLESG